MKRKTTIGMSLLAASMLAAFGVARAERITVDIPAGQPKCMDSANTQPSGCIPSVPVAQGATSSTTTEYGPGYAGVPGASTSSNTLNVNPNVGVDANVGVDNSNVNAGANISPGVNVGDGSQSVTSGANAEQQTQKPGTSSSR